MAIKLVNPLRSRIVDVVSAYLSGTNGTSGSGAMLRVYGGTQPGTGGGTAGTQEILVQIDGIAWSSGSNGTAVLAAQVTGTAGTAGAATWARLSGTDGTGYVIDGVCGTSAASDFVIDSASIVATAVVTLTAASIIQPAS